MIINKNYQELKQKNVEQYERLNKKILEMDEMIRELYQKKTMGIATGKIDFDKLKIVEKNFEKMITLLGNTINHTVNLDLHQKFIDLSMLWNSYKSGVKIQSKQEEEMEAERKLNDLMLAEADKKLDEDMAKRGIK